ncbi:amidophosphoribosyltransferase, partial [Ascosphaera pollenicola]
HRSQTHSDESHDDYHTKKPSGMEVEEKIARAYHNKLSWRKVLVRLEPDAHNNIVVRRMFANAYGWPVVAHLVEHHFVEPGSPRSAEGQPAGPANNPQDSSTDVTKNEMPDSTDVAYASPQRRMSDPGIYHSNITLDTQEIVRFGPMKPSRYWRRVTDITKQLRLIEVDGTTLFLWETAADLKDPEVRRFLEPLR